MGKPLDSADLLWLGLVLLIALAIACLLPVTPQDYWWYLRLGRDTLASGAIPQLDTFTYSQAGTPVVYHSWGAALLLWLVYQAGGLTLTVALRGLLVGAAYTLVWVSARRFGGGRIGSALVVLVAVLVSSSNWSVRPQLFAYPLFAWALYLLYRWQHGRSRGLAWLPLISLLWVNLHGSFLMLVLLMAAALVFGSGARKPLLLALAGVLAASLLNPRGAGSWTYVYQSLTVPSSQLFSAEWRPPVNEGWQMNLFFGWLLAAPCLAGCAPRKLSALEWAWFLGFGLLALVGERYVIWFVLVLAIQTARLLGEWETRLIKDTQTRRPALNLTALVLLALLPWALLPRVRELWWPEAPAATENTPVEAVDWLQEHPDLAGPLWSEIGFSSYLEFALPERPTYIDTRFELFPTDQWLAYQSASEARADWSERLAESGANLALVSSQEQPHLLAVLAGSPGWSLLYQDETAALFQRERAGGE